MPLFPELDGIVFRCFAGPTDYVAMARIINASKEADGDERTDTPDDLARAYVHLQRCDVTTDMLVVEVAGDPVGYSRVWWDQEEPGPRVYNQVCFLDPAHHGRGIGAAMLTWNEERLREIGATHEYDGERIFRTFGNDANERSRRLFADAGYVPDTYFADMVRPTVVDLPDASLPAGVEMRPVADDQLRTIFDAEAEAFRDHWGFVEPTEAYYREWLDFPHTDHSLWKIAWHGDEVVSQVRSFVNTAENEEYERARGWTEFISTHRDWRRKGVATALIVASIGDLTDRGMTEVALGVHTENPNGAFTLYEGLGYAMVNRWTVFRKEMEEAQRRT